jgi:L-amino acid N-acyltransferase YncA
MVTKFIKRTMIPQLKKEGVCRAVCLVHPLNQASQNWLRHLGFTPGATSREFGTRHEEVLLFQRDDLN